MAEKYLDEAGGRELVNKIYENFAEKEEVEALQNSIDEINGKIPAQASESNQLADKEFVTETVNSMAALYITSDASGNAFPSYAALESATVFYNAGTERTPTQNDYCVVLDDENHEGSSAQYIFQGVYGSGGQWVYQYKVNDPSFTAAQTDALNSGITAEKVSQIANNATNISNEVTRAEDAENALQESVTEIEGKIPTQASESNQLADKDFVIDSVNSLSAFYITYDASGNAFPTYSALASATVFYNASETRTPTKNDYCIVLEDENHGGGTTRYSFQGVYGSGGQWTFQYKINDTPFTQAQLNALNSGVTAAKVQEIADNATNLTSEVTRAKAAESALDQKIDGMHLYRHILAYARYSSDQPGSFFEIIDTSSERYTFARLKTYLIDHAITNKTSGIPATGRSNFIAVYTSTTSGGENTQTTYLQYSSCSVYYDEESDVIKIASFNVRGNATGNYEVRNPAEVTDSWVLR